MAQLYQQLDVAGSMGSGLNNAKSILSIQEEKKKREQEEMMNSVLAQRLPEYTKNGSVDVSGLRNAVMQDFSSQGQAALMSKMEDAFSKMDAGQKAKIAEQQEKLRPVTYQAYNTWTDLVKKHDGDKEAAAKEMNQNYWPTLSKAFKDGGAPQVEAQFTSDTEAKMLVGMKFDDMLKADQMKQKSEIVNIQEAGKDRRVTQTEEGKTERKQSTATAKPSQKDKDAQMYATKYGTDTTTAREVMNTLSFQASGDFSKALGVWRKKHPESGTGSTATATAAASTSGKKIDAATAKALLQEAGGDKEKARQLAKERGYTF